ncbi:hypothetical protein J6590_036721 [Homalodisca vitripennis]|nr:hypothetical protein J6590_036721 [Homalodisca vitripennis]
MYAPMEFSNHYFTVPAIPITHFRRGATICRYRHGQTEAAAAAGHCPYTIVHKQGINLSVVAARQWNKAAGALGCNLQVRDD